VDLGGRGHRVPNREGRRRGIVLAAVIGDADSERERVTVDWVDVPGLSGPATRAAYCAVMLLSKVMSNLEWVTGARVHRRCISQRRGSLGLSS